MIEWESLIERHVRGTCSRGTLWIRLDPQGQVAALYTLFKSTTKYLPESDEELSLPGMQLRAELILEQHELADQLAAKNKR